jgi:anion-transporting  ArsA/GET3 family ATPase
LTPAKRLKEILSLSDENSGHVTTVVDPMKTGKNVKIDAMLMNPSMTVKRIAERSNAPDISNNRILGILAKPYGGLNEILSVVELYFHQEAKNYDVIVLDTPPGAHFVDFLESVGKIKAFFDKTFVEIFNMLRSQVSDEAKSTSKKIFDKIVSTGFKPLLNYLQKVTGSSFVNEFVEAVAAIYQGQDVFLNALALQDELKDPKKANWFLVTSFDQNKVQEAMDLQAHAKDLLSEDSYVILNKSNKQELENWSASDNHVAAQLREALIKKENILRDYMQSHFKNILEFQEVHQITPQEHVTALISEWENFKNA